MIRLFWFVVALLIVAEFLAAALAVAFDWKKADVLSIMALTMAATALVVAVVAAKAVGALVR